MAKNNVPKCWPSTSKCKLSYCLICFILPTISPHHPPSKMADGDSPLSTTANIIGILTFALATFSFCLAFYAATADAPREVQSYKCYVFQRRAHIEDIRQFFNERAIEADSELEKTQLKELVSGTLTSAEDGRTELQEKVNKICDSQVMSLSKRIWWMMERRTMSMGMAGVDMQMNHLTALQISFLLR